MEENLRSGTESEALPELKGKACWIEPRSHLSLRQVAAMNWQLWQASQICLAYSKCSKTVEVAWVKTLSVPDCHRQRVQEYNRAFVSPMSKVSQYHTKWPRHSRKFQDPYWNQVQIAWLTASLQLALTEKQVYKMSYLAILNKFSPAGLSFQIALVLYRGWLRYTRILDCKPLPVDQCPFD